MKPTARDLIGAARRQEASDGRRAGGLPAGLRVRVARGIGAPRLAAIGLGAVGSSVYFVLGVVAKRSLGLTPIVFVVATAFFAITTMTYLEGTSVHQERGGSSAFARYAFDELVSFIAGWAVLLDYLIVMAIGSFAVSHYLGAFWGKADNFPFGDLVATGVMAYVAWWNIRGGSSQRLGRVIRLGLLNLAVIATVMVIGLVKEFHPGQVIDSIHLGSTPDWSDLWFAIVLATVAFLGIEAASGLASEVQVSTAGLKRLALFAVTAPLVLLVGLSAVGVMAVPIHGGSTALGGPYIDAPVLGIVSAFHPSWLMHTLRYVIGGVGALVLLQAVNGTMLGLSRLTYSLATNRQVPSLLGRLHATRSTPYVAISVAAIVATGLAYSADLEFLTGIFAFGATLAFTIAHLSVIVMRNRERDARRAFRIPLAVTVRGWEIPLPAAVGAIGSFAAWVSVLVLHSGARAVGGLWMLAGLVLYASYRLGQDKPLRKRFTIPEEALQEAVEAEFGSILVPVFGNDLDDDIVGTAGRLAADEGEEGEGGAVIEALYVVEVPLSLPLDARVPDEEIAAAKKAVARAKEVGEEYEGVTVATAMVRARAAGEAIVTEAKRRGVEAIVLAAEKPTRMRGGKILGGRGRPRDRSVGETTRYVLEKAPCRVVLTAPPEGEEGAREGVAP
ncbi:MAG: amino acid permease [Actinobacteria bacterium]|nr:MAG: amino acid permease [Actinomycetota bacterium]